MELNLKKARKLEGKVKSVLGELELATHVDLRAKTTQPDIELSAAYNTIQANITKFQQLVNARYEIRKAIADANHKVGINALMADREKLLFLAASLSKYGAVETTSSPKEVEDILAAKMAQLEKGDNSYGRIQVTVPVPVFTKADVDSFKKKILEIKKQAEDIEDELLQKNAGAKVTLSDSTVALLREYSLV